jgi:hypothetical protein
LGTRLTGLSCGACIGLSCGAGLSCGVHAGQSCGAGLSCGARRTVLRRLYAYTWEY